MIFLYIKKITAKIDIKNCLLVAGMITIIENDMFTSIPIFCFSEVVHLHAYGRVSFLTKPDYSWRGEARCERFSFVLCDAIKRLISPLAELSRVEASGARCSRAVYTLGNCIAVATYELTESPCDVSTSGNSIHIP